MQLHVSHKGLLTAVAFALCVCDHASAAPAALLSDIHVGNKRSNNASLASRAPQPLQIPLNPIGDDLAYTALVGFGTNPAPFNMLMDSGSSDLWVYSSVCPQRGTNQGITSAASPQLQVNTQAKWRVSYGDGSQVSGFMARDNLNIAGLSFPGYIFGLAGLVDGSISEKSVDGIIGFGTQRSARMKQPNLAQIFADQGIIPAPVAGWFLSRSRDGGHGGELSLGAPNPAKFNPATLTPPLANLNGGYWCVTVAGVRVNNFAIPSIANRVATFDTATSQILMPLQDAGFINQQLGALLDAPTCKFYIPCNTDRQVAFRIAGQDWAIDLRDLVFLQDSCPGGFCLSMIQGGPASLQGTWILGAAFMKNAYVIMNYATNQIQMAQLH
ncbi:acid protease [Dentipellis sp. KUC8613]|nr:acid protease [Dentipellis sp. KUC8613]